MKTDTITNKIIITGDIGSVWKIKKKMKVINKSKTCIDVIVINYCILYAKYYIYLKQIKRQLKSFQDAYAILKEQWKL